MRNWVSGRERKAPKDRIRRAYEIEPGRGVPNDWEAHLVETWSERKARLAAERAAERGS